MFSKKLDALLAKSNKTWKEVSEELSIGKNQLKYWKDNDSLPDGKTIIKLAQYFHVTSDYLLDIDNQEQQLFDKQKEVDGLTKRLVYYFSECDYDKQLRIIQFAMNEYDRTIEERKKSESGASSKTVG